MPSQPLRAARLLLALPAALAAALASPAQGQDPFALDKGLTAQTVAEVKRGPILAEIVVDGQVMPRMVTLEGDGERMTIDADDARVAGLPIDDGKSGSVRIATLHLYQWKFDSLRQRLTVERFRKADEGNLRDFAARSNVGVRATPLTAFRLDYDLSATAAGGQTSFGGLAEAALVRGDLFVGSSARYTSTPGPGSASFLRLDTRARMALPARGIVATAGDFVSAGSQSQRAVRLGGLQIASDVSLRPDLITLPLPAFSGQVAVPTTLDVLSSGARYNLGEIKPGDFTVRNIPTQPGRGEVAVILRDPLGREVMQSARFYISRNLLAPRRSEFAVNAGFVRRRFGQVSNDYGPLAASAYYRRGLSPHLTLEASGEWSGGLLNLGARADFTIANVALVTAEARFSSDPAVGTGKMLNVGLESIGRTFGGRITASIPSAQYRDVAYKLGDDAPPKSYAAQLFYRLGGRADAQLSYVRRESRADPVKLRERTFNETVSANVNATRSGRVSVSAGADWRRSERGSGFGAAIGLSLAFGKRGHGSALATWDQGRPGAAVAFDRYAHEDGQVGYNAAINWTGGTHRVAGGASWRARSFFADAQVEEVNGSLAARGNLRGTVLFADGQVFARNQSGGSYALVRTGKVGDVPITVENLVAGRTNRAGRLLVQNLPAEATVRIDVDQNDIPADAMVRSTTHMIMVPYRSVAVVDIDTIRFVPVMRKVVDPQGRALATGLPVRMMPSRENSLVGFDGMVEINAGGGDRQLLVGAAGSGCVVDLAGIDLEHGNPDQPLICEPRTIAEAPPGRVFAANQRPAAERAPPGAR